jgi:hypothetical protein
MNKKRIIVGLLISTGVFFGIFLTGNTVNAAVDDDTVEIENESVENATSLDSIQDKMEVNGITIIGKQGNSYNVLTDSNNGIMAFSYNANQQTLYVVAHPYAVVYKKNSSGKMVKTSKALAYGTQWVAIDRGNWWQVATNEYVKMGTLMPDLWQ